MMRCSGSRKILVVGALLLACGLVAPSRVQADDALNTVPPGSFFCVRINNLDGALGQIDLFLTGLVPMQVSGMVKAQLGQILGSPLAQGLDTGGSFTIFSPLPGGAGPDPSQIGILVPVSDYSQFVSGNANVSAADGQGISKIGPAGSPMLSMTQFGKFALAGRPGTEAALLEAKKSLSGGASGLAAALDAAETKQATTASIWAYVNMEAVSMFVGPMLQGKIQETKQALAGAEDDQMAAAAASLDMYASLADTFMKEAKYVSLSLNPSAGKIGAAFVLAGKPGTGMAEMLQAGPAGPSNKLLGYLNDGAIMNFAGSTNSPFWEKYNEMFLEMMPKLMGDETGTDMEAFKTMATDAMGCFGGTIAGSLSANPGGKPPFAVSYVADLKDTEKFYKVMDSVTEMMTSGPIAEMYENMGMKMSFAMQRKADTYKDVAIDSATFSLKATDENSPQAQMINAMYGDGFNVHLATTDGKLLYALGPDPSAAVRKLIDQAKTGGSSQAPGEVQSAMQLIAGADKADFFTTFNVLRFVQMLSAVAPIPVPAGTLPTQSSLAIAGGADDGKLTVELAVPKQHVQEIMGLVMQIQMQQMQQQQQQP